MEKECSFESVYPPTGIYEHYKSTEENRRYYQLLGFAQHTENDEILVIYIPLYVLPEHIGLQVLARPLEMFKENVTTDGFEQPRFRYVGNELT